MLRKECGHIVEIFLRAEGAERRRDDTTQLEVACGAVPLSGLARLYSEGGSAPLKRSISSS